MKFFKKTVEAETSTIIKRLFFKEFHFESVGNVAIYLLSWTTKSDYRWQTRAMLP